MTFRKTFARTKAPSRSAWRAQLVDWLLWRSDEQLAALTVADMPSWVDRLAKGEAEGMLRAERERRASRDAA